MNIDEFIEHAKEKAREHRYHADFFESDNPMNTACIKSAEDCEQLAGWLKKAEEYQQLEERLNKVYGDCDGLLLRVVEMLEKHPCIDMANNTLKSRLLTDEDVDKWEEYKQLEEQGKLIKLLCNRGDKIYFIKSAFSMAHFPIEATVTSICGVNCDNDVMYSSITEYNKIDRRFRSSDIGKTVFLTKSEAEAKLEELRGNND